MFCILASLNFCVLLLLYVALPAIPVVRFKRLSNCSFLDYYSDRTFEDSPTSEVGQSGTQTGQVQ